MIVLPLPLIFAGLMLYVLGQSVKATGTWRSFHTLLAACAVQSALIALVHHYGFRLGFTVLPFLAACLPPLAWLSFQDAMFGKSCVKSAAVHLTAPAVTLLARLIAPGLIDLIIPATFVFYGVALLWALRRTDLPLARLAAGPVPQRVWAVIALFLITSACVDVIVFTLIALDKMGTALLIISLVSSAFLLCIALLGLAHEAVAESQPSTPEPQPPTEDDAALVQRLDALLAQEKLFLEPDLTLSRLAKRMHVPIKHLSGCINRARKQNTSRYVNGFRIDHACTLLKQGQPVTDVIYASGFNTKSNFNREFLQITGKSPSLWQSENVT